MNSCVLFRTDVSSEIGAGHVMRCITLASYFKENNFEIVFLCRQINFFFEEVLEKKGFSLRKIPESDNKDVKYYYSKWLAGTEAEDYAHTSKIISSMISKGKSIKLIVVDHYALGAEWEAGISDFAPILSIDDLNDRPHSAKWLLDQTPGKCESEYFGLVDMDTKILLGASYALVRSEFYELREKSLWQKRQCAEVSKILVNMGGVDKSNRIALVLDSLENCISGFEITIIAGMMNPHISMLKEKVSNNSRHTITLVRQTDHMEVCMANAELCIGAAGSSSWERCVMGLPTISIVLERNQEMISESLDKLGAATNFGVLEPDRLAELSTVVNKYVDDLNYYREKVNGASQVCDGMGRERVYSTVVGSL